MWSTRAICTAAMLVASLCHGLAQQHPALRLGLLAGWRVAVQTSEVDGALTRRAALGMRPDVAARARWNIDRERAIGLVGELAWSTQSTAIGQGSTNVVTQLDYLVGVVGATYGPAWIGLGYGHPLAERVRVANIDGVRQQVTHHHDGTRLASVIDVRAGAVFPIVVTDVGDVDLGFVLGTSLSSAYVPNHPGLLRSAWFRVDVGWTIELW